CSSETPSSANPRARVNQRALGGNLLFDPSFEDGPVRVVGPLDRPWGGEEDEQNAVIITQGIARTGNQSARMQAADQAQLWQRFPVNPGTDYTATCWIAADPALGLSDGLPGHDAAMIILRTDVVCPVDVCDNDGDEDIDHGQGV